MKPLINREKLQKVIVRAGAVVKFDVDVKGEPPPTITWNFAMKEMQSGPRTKIENEDYNTKIAIAETTRKDTGIYTVIAVNSNGRDEAPVEVVVLGKFSVMNLVLKYVLALKCNLYIAMLKKRQYELV